MSNKKKKSSSIKVGLNALVGISIYLLLSTIYDFSQGDLSTSRYVTFGIALGSLLASILTAGSHKIYSIIKKQMGY